MSLKMESFWGAIKTPLFLTLVVTVCIGFISIANYYTKPSIINNQKNDENLAIAKILNINIGDDVKLVESEINQLFDRAKWDAVRKKDRFVKKFIFIETQNQVLIKLNGSGYGGKIIVLALYNLEGQLINSLVIDHSETDGIGSKISSDGYMDRFAGYGADEAIPSSKRKVKSEYVDSISGATVSFRAVAKSLQKGVDFIKSEEFHNSLNGGSSVEN